MVFRARQRASCKIFVVDKRPFRVMGSCISEWTHARRVASLAMRHRDLRASEFMAGAIGARDRCTIGTEQAHSVLAMARLQPRS
jgi:hypothetical protein